MNFARLKCKSTKGKQHPHAGVLDEIAGAPVDAPVIALLIKLPSVRPINDKRLAIQPRTEPASTMLRSCRTSKTRPAPVQARPIAAAQPSRP